jgi:hypothetical protein
MTNKHDNFLNDFLASTNTEINVQFLKNDYHFAGDKDKRDIYQVTIKRGQRKFSFDFGQSIIKSQYYKDRIEGRTYTLNGGCRTGNYSIRDLNKYVSGGMNVTLIKGEEPTAYDILACLQKYDVGSFEDFCSEFGYDEDSKTAEKIYKAVCKEFDNVCKIWTDEEIELLQEIN